MAASVTRTAFDARSVLLSVRFRNLTILNLFHIRGAAIRQ